VRGTWEERLGQAAYETYGQEIEATHVLARWENLPPRVQRAWGKVATAVVHKAVEEREAGRKPS
jgi:hypothetical protein